MRKTITKNGEVPNFLSSQLPIAQLIMGGIAKMKGMVMKMPIIFNLLLFSSLLSSKSDSLCYLPT